MALVSGQRTANAYPNYWTLESPCPRLAVLATRIANGVSVSVDGLTVCILYYPIIFKWLFNHRLYWFANSGAGIVMSIELFIIDKRIVKRG